MNWLRVIKYSLLLFLTLVTVSTLVAINFESSKIGSIEYVVASSVTSGVVSIVFFLILTKRSLKPPYRSALSIGILGWTYAFVITAILLDEVIWFPEFLSLFSLIVEAVVGTWLGIKVSFKTCQKNDESLV